MCEVSHGRTILRAFSHIHWTLAMDVTTTLGWVNLATLGFEEAVFLCACGDLLKKSWLICSH